MGLNWIELVQPPHLDLRRRHQRGLQLVLRRQVAAQVDPFEKANF
jgi:hypothetical protein